MTIFSNQSQRVVLFFICLFIFFAFYNHLFLSYDQRQTVDHEFFYTNNAVSAHYASNYQGKHDVAEVIFSRSHRPQFISAFLFGILKVLPHNFYYFRVGIIPFFFLIILAGFLIGRELNGSEIGVISAAICATLPVFINYSHKWHYHYQTFGLCIIGIYFALHIAHQSRVSHIGWWVGMGICFGVAALNHPISLLFFLISIALLTIHLPFFPKHNRRKAFGLLFVSFGSFLAVAGYFYLAHFDSYIQNVLIRWRQFGHWYIKIFGGQDTGGIATIESTGGFSFIEIIKNFSTIFVADKAYMLDLPYFHIFFLFLVPVFSFIFFIKREGLTKKVIKHLEILVIVVVILFLRSYFSYIGSLLVDWSAYLILLAPLSVSLLKEWLVPQETEEAKPPPWRRNLFRLLIVFWVVAGFGLILYSYFGSFYYNNPYGLLPLNRFYFRGHEEFVRRENKLMFHVHLEPNNSGRIAKAIGSYYPPGSMVRIVYRKLTELDDGNWHVEKMDFGEVGRNHAYHEIYHGLYFDKIFMPQHRPFVEEEVDAEAFDSYDQIIYLFVQHRRKANREIPLHNAIAGPYQTIKENFPAHQIIKVVHTNDSLPTDADIWNDPLFVLAPKKTQNKYKLF